MGDVSTTRILSAGENLTAAKLNDILGSSSVDLLGVPARGTAAYSVAFISDAAPASPLEGWLWYDTSQGVSEGLLRAYSGAAWIPVAEGFLGQNNTGSLIAAGALVSSAPSQTGGLGKLAEIRPSAAVSDLPIGIALGAISAGAPGVILSRGRALLALKSSSAAVSAGDPIVPAGEASGAATGNLDPLFGPLYGSGTIGIFTKDAIASAVTAEVFLTGPERGVWLKTAVPNLVLAGAAVAADSTWSGSFGTPVFIQWSSSPKNIQARIIQISLVSSAASSQISALVGIRQNGSTAVPPGVPSIAGSFATAAAPGTSDALAGSLIVPTPPGSADKAEFFIALNPAGGIGNLSLTIHETGVICGGA